MSDGTTATPEAASAPSSDGQTTAPATPAPAGETAAKPEGQTDPANTKPSTPEGTSPSDKDARAEGDKAEGEAEKATPDPRDVVPDAADGYAVNLDDTQKAALGLTEGDPLVSSLSEWAKEQGWSQGRVDDVLTAAAALAAKGMLGAPFDPAAELAKLGENGEGRRTEIETFANALKARGDLTEGEHAVFVSLAAEADGVTLIEKLRGRMGDSGVIEAPDGGNPGAGTHEALLKEAREMRKDPRYESDRAFQKQADAKWQEAFRAKK